MVFEWNTVSAVEPLKLINGKIYVEHESFYATDVFYDELYGSGMLIKKSKAGQPAGKIFRVKKNTAVVPDRAIRKY